ncbi:MAG: hypothetical protein R2705_22215 [Ilumatobacteraceae bacterium]
MPGSGAPSHPSTWGIRAERVLRQHLARLGAPEVSADEMRARLKRLEDEGIARTLAERQAAAQRTMILDVQPAAPPVAAAPSPADVGSRDPQPRDPADSWRPTDRCRGTFAGSSAASARS